MTRTKDILTNMLKVVNNGFWNNPLPFSDPDMDMITLEHIDVNALKNVVNKKIRTLYRPHSLMLDDMPSPPKDMMRVVCSCW